MLLLLLFVAVVVVASATAAVAIVVVAVVESKECATLKRQILKRLFRNKILFCF